MRKSKVKFNYAMDTVINCANVERVFNRCVFFTETRLPGIPTDFEATPDTTSITLNWKSPKDSNRIMVRGYNIGWGTNSADEFVQYVTDHVTSHTIENLGKYMTAMNCYWKFVWTGGTLALFWKQTGTGSFWNCSQTLCGLYYRKCWFFARLESNTAYKISLSANNEVGDGPAIIKTIRTAVDGNYQFTTQISLYCQTAPHPLTVWQFLALESLFAVLKLSERYDPNLNANRISKQPLMGKY